MADREIYFAGGCFWGVEEFYSRIPGVVETEAGYANGNTEHPTYEDVCYKNTGYAETVRVRYSSEVLLQHLVEKFFGIINPLSLNRQGNDVGSQYRSGIYYTDEADLPIIRAAVAEEQEKHEKTIVTEVLPLQNYHRAEEYHQNYLKKNPGGYCHIRLD